nr:MAG TPA: hypothetical protein [Caudoviricetes sp.]
MDVSISLNLLVLLSFPSTSVAFLGYILHYFLLRL